MSDVPTPTMSIVKSAISRTTDSKGRVIEYSRLTPLDHMRLTRVAGVDAKNDAWMVFVLLAYSLTSIDGTPLPKAQSVAQLESVIDRLGEEGFNAMIESLTADTVEDTVPVEVPLA